MYVRRYLVHFIGKCLFLTFVINKSDVIYFQLERSRAIVRTRDCHVRHFVKVPHESFLFVLNSSSVTQVELREGYLEMKQTMRLLTAINTNRQFVWIKITIISERKTLHHKIMNAHFDHSDQWPFYVSMEIFQYHS